MNIIKSSKIFRFYSSLVKNNNKIQTQQSYFERISSLGKLSDIDKLSPFFKMQSKEQLGNKEFRNQILESINKENYPFKTKRVSKAVSKIGFLSSRETESLILDGKIQVNGRTIDRNVPVSKKCDILIKKDGKTFVLKWKELNKKNTWMIAFQKPRNVECTNKFVEGRIRLIDSVKESLQKNPGLLKHFKIGEELDKIDYSIGNHQIDDIIQNKLVQTEINDIDLFNVKTIGRLDFQTEGLIILTNNGNLKRQMELPKHQFKRTYHVRVQGTIDDRLEKKFADYNKPFVLDVPLFNQNPDNYENEDQEINKDNIIGSKKVFYQGCKISLLKRQKSNAQLKVDIREGKNREIRNIMRQGLNLKVSKLIRVSFDEQTTDKMSIGQLRKLTISDTIWEGFQHEEKQNISRRQNKL